jgi:peptide/nickel transport system substrate-binding protein
MSQLISLVACFLYCGLSIAGCGGGGHEASPTLRIAIEAMPTRLDPRYAMDAHASRIGSLVFASLLRSGADGGYTPYIASSWEWVDALTCRFHLRRDFLFHDGTTLTVRDVVATYTALMDPDMGSPRRAVLTRVRDVRATSEDTVVFELSAPDAAFLEAATVGILPARQAVSSKLDDRDLVGAGPYRIASIDDDEAVRLNAFDGFADGRPGIEAIEFRVVPDELMRAMELRHGTIDLVENAIDPDTVRWLGANADGLTVTRGPSDSFQYLGMNFEHPALKDVRVRRAIAYALDREALVEHLLEGQAEVATGLLPPHHWAYTDHVRRYHHDPARARRLLDRAGFPDPDGDGPRPRLVLDYKTTTQELRRRIAEAMADQLRRVGIELDIRTYEWGTFYADVKRGSFHLYSLAWVGVTDPDIYRMVFNSAMIPPAGNNRGHFRDRRMDVLTERGATALDRGKRRRIYARIQRLAARRLPYIPLWWPQNVIVATTALDGFVPHPSGDLFELHDAALARGSRSAD